MPSQQNPVSVPATSASELSSALQTELTAALISNGSIPRIQSAITHELQLAGWTTNLRAYIQDLLRSGECTTYNEVMNKVLAEAKPANASADGVNGDSKKLTNGVNGVHRKTSEEGSIRVPDRAVREGIRVVRKELESLCEITYD